MAPTMGEILDRLHERDYKVTPQRQVVIETFLEKTGAHLSAEDVYQTVKEKHPEIGLATVYRTLELLAELRILEKMNFGDGRIRYEFADEAHHHHHHLICLQCGRVEEFWEDLLDALEQSIAQKRGFQVRDHQLKFFGVCQECSQKAAH